jgi:multidrug transporter EmrE-like cation transporter
VTGPLTGERRLQAGAWWLLGLNLVLLAGQAGLGKQAALAQQGVPLRLFIFNPFYLASLGCLLLQALVWPLVLRRCPLGFAYGVNSLNYVSILVLSYFVFSEPVTAQNLVGVGLIVAGVWVWSRDVRAAA